MKFLQRQNRTHYLSFPSRNFVRDKLRWESSVCSESSCALDSRCHGNDGFYNSLVMIIMICVILVCLQGCAVIPFQKTSYIPMDYVDPQALVEEFRNNSPESFQIMNTIVFEYSWNKFSGIGYIYVDTVEKAFRVVCMNPMGVKLFELSGDKGGIIQHFVLEQFSKQINFAGTVGVDIRRIYFDLAPSPGARVKKKKYEIVFSEPAGAGVMEYIFAGAGGYLVEKNYYEENALNWGVSYYEYLERNGRIYPRGIILNNYKYGYSLTVKLKDVQT